MAGENIITVGVERTMGFNMTLTQNEFGAWNAKLTGPTQIDSAMFGLLKPKIDTALGNLEAQGKITGDDLRRLTKELKDQAKVADTEREKMKLK